MKSIFKNAKFKFLLMILAIVVAVSGGFIINDRFINNAYQKLLDQTVETAKIAAQGDVVYTSQVKDGHTVIAYIPTDDQNQGISEISAAVQQKASQLLQTSNKKDTVNILYAKKEQLNDQTTVYQLLQEEYVYRKNEYQKQVFQLFETLVKSDQFLTFGKLLKNEKTEMPVVIEQIKTALQQEAIDTSLRKQLLAQLSPENVAGFKYVLDGAKFGLIVKDNDKDVIVPLNPKLIVPYFNVAYLSDDMKSEISEQLATVAKERLDRIKEQPQQQSKQIALTFDDGPHPTRTPFLLDVLKEENVKATFFVLGKNVAFNPAVTKRIFNEGHQVASHSYTHPNLATLNEESIKSELDRTINIIKDTIGIMPTSMRPPYGAFNDKVATQNDLAVIMWNVDSNDWRDRNREKIRQNVLRQTTGGSIILLHDIHEESVQSVRGIIKDLKAKGFEFVTVDELYGGKENLVSNAKYFSQFNVRQ